VKVRYKRSALGFLWTMAQPATMLLVLTLIFSRAFAPHAIAYAIYVAPGLLLWYFFAQTTSMIVAEAGAGTEIWSRLRVPKTTNAIATTVAALLNLALATLPLIVLLPFAGVSLGPALLTLPLTAMLTAMFALGVALLVAACAMHLPDVGDLFQALLLPWMIVSPVIYPRTILPAIARQLLVVNPMAPFIDAYRAPLTGQVFPSLGSVAVMTTLAIAALVLGLIVYTRSAAEAATRG